MSTKTPKEVKKVTPEDLGIMRQARERLNDTVEKVNAHNARAAQIEAQGRELNEALSQARGAVLFVDEMICTKYAVDPAKEQVNLDTGEVSPWSSK